MCLAVPGRLVEIDNSGSVRMGKLDFGGVIKRVCLEFLPELQIGEYAIVHVGFAIGRLDEESALLSLQAIRELGEQLDEPEALPD